MKIKQTKNFFYRHIRLWIFAAAILALGAILVYQLIIAKKEYIVVRVKGSPGNWWWVTPRPPDWLALSINKGDKEYNSANHATAEVLAVDVYDTGGTTRDTYLTVRLEAKHNKQTNQYRYKGEPVEIGDPISLSLNNSFFPGMIIEIHKDGEYAKNYVEKIVHIRHKDRWPYEFEAIQIGDKVIDGNGIIITEILEKSKKPSLQEGINYFGQLVQTESKIMEDFYLTVRIKTKQIGSEFVYREDQYIKIGNKMWILLPSYNMSEAEILSID